MGVNKFGEGQTLAQCKSSKPANMQLLNIEAWSAVQMLQLVESAGTSGVSANYRGLNNLFNSKDYAGSLLKA